MGRLDHIKKRKGITFHDVEQITALVNSLVSRRRRFPVSDRSNYLRINCIRNKVYNSKNVPGEYLITVSTLNLSHAQSYETIYNHNLRQEICLEHDRVVIYYRRDFSRSATDKNLVDETFDQSFKHLMFVNYDS